MSKNKVGHVDILLDTVKFRPERDGGVIILRLWNRQATQQKGVIYSFNLSTTTPKAT
ncbi:MAG: hypothetical protein AB4063_17825 [Crocosphaera sp.]